MRFMMLMIPKGYETAAPDADSAARVTGTSSTATCSATRDGVPDRLARTGSNGCANSVP